jgi:hypothetical protein
MSDAVFDASLLVAIDQTYRASTVKVQVIDPQQVARALSDSHRMTWERCVPIKVKKTDRKAEDQRPC